MLYFQVFRDITLGFDSFIWNVQTTILILLDTHDLNYCSDKIKSTQYFHLLTSCLELLSQDREEKVLLVCDEAYLLIDENVLQSLAFLRNAINKRARKYEAEIVIISHSVVDFLSEKTKQY